jgi:hypothetical protein
MKNARKGGYKKYDIKIVNCKPAWTLGLTTTVVRL